MGMIGAKLSPSLTRAIKGNACDGGGELSGVAEAVIVLMQEGARVR